MNDWTKIDPNDVPNKARSGRSSTYPYEEWQAALDAGEAIQLGADYRPDVKRNSLRSVLSRAIQVGLLLDCKVSARGANLYIIPTTTQGTGQ